MPVRLAKDEKLPPPLDGYTLIERLGRGGFGEVWKAEAPGGLFKAVKFVFGDLDGDDTEENRPARQEEKALNRVKNIRHPYILSLERYDVIDGQLAIVMELADCNMWDRFRKCHGLGMHGIPRDELLSYMEEAAEALDLMNGRYSIQHLDVKPQNLFLVYNHVKVGDFGLAKVLEGVRGTITGGVTPVYAGPETFNGDVSRYTDQYSLGIVFQEMLTGRRPFNGSNTKQLVMQHLTGAPDLEPLPPADRPAIARALAKEPEQRWPSCLDLVRALKQSVVVATPPPVLRSKLSPASPTPPVPSPSIILTVPSTIQQSQPTARSASARLPAGRGANPGTPLPRAATPRLVTPQAAAAAQNGPPTLSAAPTRTSAEVVRAAGPLQAPPERSEEGVLLPALIVGIGHYGRLVIKQMKRAVSERFGAAAVDHIRYLYIDTDPDGIAAAVAPRDPEPLSNGEMVLARLNRPAHYTQRQGIPSVEQWMPPGALYRLPRDPRPAGGVRAFGRLAFVDHYRTIVQRLRLQIEAIATDTALDAAARSSGLGVRSNRGRTYVVAGLAGGTGSGMFLDLAYLVKHELRQIGYRHPETVGMLLVPPADAATTRSVGLANTYTALAELRHFHNGRGRYTAHFDTADAPLNDSDGPFSRTTLVQLAKRDHPKDHQRTAGLVARSIFLDLFTPTGRTTDSVRAEAFALNRDKVPVVQTLGLYRLSWPRAAVLTAATNRFVQRLLQRWMMKESAHLREPVRDWLDEKWASRKLDLEAVVDSFSAAVRAYLQEEPERVFAAFVDPLRQGGLGTGRMDAAAAASVLEQILKVVGKPDQEKDHPGSLHPVLAEAYKTMAKSLEQDLFAWTGSLVEQPLFRLAGAEEAVEQIRERLKRIIDGLEGVRDDLNADVRETFGRLFPVIGNLSVAGRGVIGPSRTALANELFDLAYAYPTKRLKLMVLDVTLALYRGLAGTVPECQREVGELRSKLSQMSTAFGTGESPTIAGPGRMILPHGVVGLDGAADQFIGSLPPQDIADFDQAVQATLTKACGGVIGACTKAGRQTDTHAILVTSARQFLDARLEAVDPAALFFRTRDPGPATDKLLLDSFEEAAPDLTGISGRPQTEVTILACPGGPEGDLFRHHASVAIPGVGFIPAVLPDDIAFIREYPLLPFADLPQLAAHARAAYEAQSASDHPPHARADVKGEL